MSDSRIETEAAPGHAGLSPQGDVAVQDWLVTQCAQVEGADAGLVLSNRGGVLTPTALWPAAQSAAPLLELGERAGHAAKGLITELGRDGGGLRFGIAYPVQRAGLVVAVAALAVRAASEADLPDAMRRLKWGAAGLELLFLRRDDTREAARIASMEASLDILSSMLAEEKFDAAALALVTALADRFGADRVAIGLVEEGAVKVKQLSHASQFGERMNLTRLIEAAMDEAVDQASAILMPMAPGGALVHLAHDALVANEPGAVMTLPLFRNGEPVAALTVERPQDRPFTPDEQQLCESLGALAIAALDEKRHAERPLKYRIKDWVLLHWDRLRQPGRVDYRIGAGVAAALLLFIIFARGTDHLAADAVLSPQVERVLAAPFDGYVKVAPRRAGDKVRKGQLLAALDDADLQLERAKWVSQLGRFGGLTQDAAVSNDRVQTNVNAAQRDEAQAGLDLTDALIARAALRAPFDGLVVSGDLSQRIGGAVTKGDVLFTVAPTGNYRVDLNVKESRIADIQPGQTGVLHLSALPARNYQFTIRKVTPRTVAQNGATYFVIEGILDKGQDLSDLLPGMEGIGKVDVGSHWLVGIWTRDLAEWVRLKLWGLFG